MSKGIGRLQQVLIAKESVRGTAISSNGYYVPFSDASPESKIEFATDNSVYGIIENSVSKTLTKTWMEGELKAPVRDIHFGLILKALLGSESASSHAGETVVVDHKFTVGENAQHPSITFGKHDPLAGTDYLYANGVIHKLDIEVALKKFINYSASITALKGQATSLTPVNTTENYFVPQYLTFKAAANIAGLSGASAIQLKSAKISIDEAIEHQDVLGSTAPADFLNKEFKVSGEFTAIWKGEADFFTQFITPTAQALQLDIKNTDVTIGSSANPEMIIQLDQVYFTEVMKPIKPADLVYQTVKFEAVYNLTNAEMINIVLTNTKTGTY